MPSRGPDRDDPSRPMPRYRARPPRPLSDDEALRWLQYVPKMARRATSSNIASYGSLVAQYYTDVGPPEYAIDLDRLGGGNAARDMLARSRWGVEQTARDLARDVLVQGPKFLLATSIKVRGSRSARPRIFGISALFDDDYEAPPVAWRRSYGDLDSREDLDAVGRLACATTKVAGECGCRSPIVCCELELAYLLRHALLDSSYPFIVQIDPIWFPKGLEPQDRGYQLTGGTPEEIFGKEGDHIYRRTVNEETIELVRMWYRERQNDALFYTQLPGQPDLQFLVRAPVEAGAGSTRQIAAAAVLTLAAADLRHERPIADLQVDMFCASDPENERWYKHATILQARLTFDFLLRTGQLPPGVA